MSGKRFVPSSTIRARMDAKDLRFQRAATRAAALRTILDVKTLVAKPPLIADPDYNARSMAVHFLRRIADGIEHRWAVDPEDVQIALSFLYQCEPALRPKDESL